MFVNLIERTKIGGAFVWINAGHDIGEVGVNLPDLSAFETSAQDITLDRAHPAITNSTGNYPLRAPDRINEKKYPRGHYNMGLTWDHANIIDVASEIVFPLKYNRRVAIGKGIPDQPARITVSVTPRRPRNFTLRDGETLKWSWDGDALSGIATVTGDTVTVDAIPLVSGDVYKALRIYR
jgi:peptidoglycan/xylan/chitin deacetylase (PgdA/CDA1 family)